MVIACSGGPQPQGRPVAITGVAVVSPVDGSVRSGMTILVADGRISALGPDATVPIPEGAYRIAGEGKYAIPGLWDMHVHTGSDSNAREIVYPLMVAHGVTGIRNMSGDCIDCGPDLSVSVWNARRRAVEAGEIIGPRVVMSSDYAGSHEQAFRRMAEGSSPEAPGTPEDARAFVRLSEARGVDFLKIYDMLPRSAYFALADEAKSRAMGFAGHVPVEIRASEASDAGQASIEHPRGFGILLECSTNEDELRARIIEEFEKAEMGNRYTADGPAILPLTLEMVESHDPEKCADLAQRFVRNGTRVVPTLMTGPLPGEPGADWRQNPYARFLTSEEWEYWAWEDSLVSRDLGDARSEAPVRLWERGVTYAMHEAGVEILAGSDAGANVYWGDGLHGELELLVGSGLTPAEALRSATAGPADFLAASDSLGMIEVGKVADLVLLSANPLEDIRNTRSIDAVIIRGRVFDREALDELLEGAEAAAGAR